MNMYEYVCVTLFMSLHHLENFSEKDLDESTVTVIFI